MTNSYVKTCLTLIVLLLALIALRPIFSPTNAEAQMAVLQLVGTTNGFLVYASTSREVWFYEMGYVGSGITTRVTYLGRMLTPGQPLVTR